MTIKTRNSQELPGTGFIMERTMPTRRRSRASQRTVRELGGEIWAELTMRFSEEKVDWQVKSEITEMVMGVLARYDGVRIKIDKDFPVQPLERITELQRE